MSGAGAGPRQEAFNQKHQVNTFLQHEQRRLQPNPAGDGSSGTEPQPGWTMAPLPPTDSPGCKALLQPPVRAVGSLPDLDPCASPGLGPRSAAGARGGGEDKVTPEAVAQDLVCSSSRARGYKGGLCLPGSASAPPRTTQSLLVDQSGNLPAQPSWSYGTSKRQLWFSTYILHKPHAGATAFHTDGIGKGQAGEMGHANLMEFNEAKCKVLPWVRASPSTDTGWGRLHGAALRRT
ncbi:uncharacterized protein ACIB01_015148 [Guaruba guarouba]